MNLKINRRQKNTGIILIIMALCLVGCPWTIVWNQKRIALPKTGSRNHVRRVAGVGLLENVMNLEQASAAVRPQRTGLANRWGRSAEDNECHSIQ